MGQNDTPNESTDRTTTEPADRLLGIHVDDRLIRDVRSDHATVSTLHDALQAADPDPLESATYNLMADPNPDGPDGFEVWCKTTNEGEGNPQVPDVVRRMVVADDAVITDVVECSDDTLTVSIRPVETRVEPVQVDRRDLPDDLVDVQDLRSTFARVLRKVSKKYGAESDRANETARAFTAVLAIHDEVDDIDATYRDLWRTAGVDTMTGDVDSKAPVDAMEERRAFDTFEDMVEAVREGEVDPHVSHRCTYTTPTKDDDEVFDALRYAPAVDASDVPPREPIREFLTRDDVVNMLNTGGTTTEGGFDFLVDQIAAYIAAFGNDDVEPGDVYDLIRDEPEDNPSNPREDAEE